MRKLSTFIGTVVLVATVSLAGCKKKESTSASAGSAAALPTEAPPAGSAAPPAVPPPTEGSAAAAGSAAGSGAALTLDIPEGTPKECVEYAEVVMKVLGCEKVSAEQKATYKDVAQSVLKHQVSPQLTPEAQKGGIQGCVDSVAFIKKDFANDCTF